jgi:glycerophosphodiester phosphodiesterase
LQEKEGIDAVIVDNVLAVRKGLTAPVQDTESMTGSATSGPSNSLTASTDPSVAPSSDASATSSDVAEQDVTESSSGIAIRVDDGSGKSTAAVGG